MMGNLAVIQCHSEVAVCDHKVLWLECHTRGNGNARIGQLADPIQHRETVFGNINGAARAQRGGDRRADWRRSSVGVCQRSDTVT